MASLVLRGSLPAGRVLLMSVQLGKITLPPTPKPGSDLASYQQAVSVWTRQCEQTLRQFERAVNSIATTAGTPGPPGAPGTPGGAGPSGISAGIKYLYSTDTASTDPTSGKLKFDSVTLSSITSFRISETDADSNGIAALISTWASSTTVASRATIVIIKDGAPSNLLAFSVSGALTDNGTWDTLPITFISTSGSFSNGDTLRVFFSMTGNTGTADMLGVQVFS